MAQEEQMKVQELMWNHQQKLLEKPTSEQIVRSIVTDWQDYEGNFISTIYLAHL